MVALGKWCYWKHSYWYCMFTHWLELLSSLEQCFVWFKNTWALKKIWAQKRKLKLISNLILKQITSINIFISSPFQCILVYFCICTIPSIVFCNLLLFLYEVNNENNFMPLNIIVLYQVFLQCDLWNSWTVHKTVYLCGYMHFFLGKEYLCFSSDSQSGLW